MLKKYSIRWKIDVVICIGDKLLSLPKDTKNVIINLEDGSGNGSHWVCVFNDKAAKYYFDSCGLPPPIEVVKILREGVLSDVSNTSHRFEMLQTIVLVCVVSSQQQRGFLWHHFKSAMNIKMIYVVKDGFTFSVSQELDTDFSN